MLTFSVSEARKNWKHVLSLVEEKGEHVFISKHGKIVAVLVPISDAERFMYFEENEDMQG